MTLGERIKARRIDRGLSIEQLSRTTGIPKTTLRRYETDSLSYPKPQTLEKIAMALRCDVSFTDLGLKVSSVTLINMISLLAKLNSRQQDSVIWYACHLLSGGEMIDET